MIPKNLSLPIKPVEVNAEEMEIIEYSRIPQSDAESS
jgi:hypothetical protein